MTEIEYLDGQEARARKALTDSARRIVTEFSRVVPLEQVVRDHPVLALGAGAAGGVATGFLLGRLLGSRGSAAVLGTLRTLAWPTVRRFRRAAVDALFASAPSLGTVDADEASD